MLRSNAKTKMISEVPLFEGLSKQELAKVASIADEIDFRAGKTLIREGQRGREFFVLVDGTVEVRQAGKLLGEGTAGDFFGEIALVSKVPRTATVTTTSEVRALVISEHEFRALLKQSPQIALKVLEAVALRLPTDV